MSEPVTIRAVYEEDHDRLDELFKTFQRLKHSDFAKANEAFTAFTVGLQRHIVWEEELLFPLWEEKTGMAEGGPTAVMRAEHRQIRALLDAIHDKLAAQPTHSDQEEQALLALLGSHNMKEERVLYPSIDQVTTPEERELVYERMRATPEDRAPFCCGGHDL
jgi:hemerythrin-like domain-containing protein